MIQATLPQDEISFLIATGQRHFRPIYAAMRGGRVAFLLVRQGKDRFRVRDGQTFVAVIGDDMDQALGPSAFHGKSLRRLARQARGVAIISCELMPDVYATAANVAQLGQSTLIVETQPEREGEWMALLREAAPSASVLLCTVIEGTA